MTFAGDVRWDQLSSPWKLNPEVTALTQKKGIRVVAAEVEHDGRFLITQRRPNAMLPLLWEFPSGRVEEGESDEEALRRELMERLGVEADVGKLSMFIKHDYPDYALDFCVYRCQLLTKEIRALRVAAWRWVTPAEMDHYDFPPADAETIRQLLESR